MHDGTPEHFFRNEREHLTLTFQDRWIDLGRPHTLACSFLKSKSPTLLVMKNNQILGLLLLDFLGIIEDVRKSKADVSKSVLASNPLNGTEAKWLDLIIDEGGETYKADFQVRCCIHLDFAITYGVVQGWASGANPDSKRGRLISITHGINAARCSAGKKGDEEKSYGSP
ncbi:hypothetical protein ANN_10496 [Periplaneta americana]|uniref:Uncharacterized protein n=1 Tax=Periplaneta americana TaxID=6978 RepID=A0ABQ8TP88_PERAM|nr:hypothetical protein ANN_10496 [Periplaneta americana]